MGAVGGPVRERIVAVFSGGRQGSGYLLSPRLVLTAAHVIRDVGDIRVMTVSGRSTCEPLWSRDDDACDAALLLASRDLVPAGAPGLSDRLRWGARAGLAPVPDCQAIGFPYAQRTADGRLDTEQLIGTFKPGSALLSGRYVLDSVHMPPERRDGAPSPWAGFSGAAVFAGEVLIGVVASAPRGWRHGRVEATAARELFSDTRFLTTLSGHNVPEPLYFPLPTAPADPVADFEAHYTAYLEKKHGTLTIFGLDLRDRSAAGWPLDAAYLSLEAVPSDADAAQAAVPLPADRALAGQRRVLLRGVAGSGKTTLVQWLAVRAARDGDGTIPFVLPLRTLIRRGPLPEPGRFLAAAGNPLADRQPDGWAAGVLGAGRALVMVDGIDEISERERDQVRDWLRDLLIAYPGNSWLVTSRPSAVADSWLAGEGFTELTLSPMSRDDITSFVTRWHTAAGAGCEDPEERERLDGYRRSLLTAIATKQDLARLATNPLMCGLICALHRDRRGYLPHGRRELYEAGLAMLLADRDQRRDIGAPDGIELAAEPQIQLLQRLAYWLIRNGRSELDRSHAERLLADALPAVPSAAAQGDAPAILRHLLVRSGLLREPAPGTVEFVHRTFQDYLGARRLVEEWDIGLLIEKAADTQWEDVVRMAVAQGRPRERAEILTALIARGDADETVRPRVHLLAMACLEHATELDPAVRSAVEERAAAFLPPRTVEAATRLADDVGPIVLELLPGPEGLDDETARAVVVTASRLSTDAAIGLLRRFRDHGSLRVRSQLTWCWHRFEAKRYFDDVIRHLHADDLYFTAHTTEHLRLLTSAGGRPLIQVRGDHPAELLREYLDPERLTGLRLKDNEVLTDLCFLDGYRRLTELGLFDCPPSLSLAPLVGLPLESLTFQTDPDGRFPAGLPGITTLRRLLLVVHNQPSPPTESLPGLEELGLVVPEISRLDLAWIPEVFPGLRELVCEFGEPEFEPVLDLTPLTQLTALRRITIGNAQVIGEEKLPSVFVELLPETS